MEGSTRTSRPHNEHLLLLPVAVFKALFATVGLGHYWPYRLAVVVVHLVCVALMFVIVDAAAARPCAAVVAAPILLLGSSSEVLLFPIDLGFAGSMAAGLGALLALDARSRRADLVACLLLIVALASSGLGLPILLGVLVEVLWDGDRLRRIWVAVVPASLYGVWYLAYNLHPNRQGPLEYADAPVFALRVAGAAVAGLLGVPEFELAGTRVAAWPGRASGSSLFLAGVLALVGLVAARRRLSAAPGDVGHDARLLLGLRRRLAQLHGRPGGAALHLRRRHPDAADRGAGRPTTCSCRAGHWSA